MSRDELLMLAGEQAGRLAAQDGQITALARQVADLMEANDQLAAKLARVQRLLSRNSGNSSLPPSMDDQPGRRPPEGKGRPMKGGGRSPGKQPGAPGSHLAWSKNPDDTIPHFPGAACECGAPLAGARDLGVAASHQVMDIPLQTATVTQHNLHEVACGCGRVHRATAPAGAGAAGTVSYGLGLQAWYVYLIAAHAIPVHRCAELVETLTGAEPSPGFVHSMIARAAAAVAAANRAIRCLIILAHVVSADETPVRVGPGPKTRKRYLLVTCTHLLTCYFLGDRSMKTFTAFVLPDMGGTVVVHDRYQNYDAVPGLIHQLCTQHLLRDLAAAAQTYPVAHWPRPGRRGAAGPDPRREHRPRAGTLPAIPDEIAAPLIRAFKHGVLVGLAEVPRVVGRKQRPCRDLLECLRDRQADVLRFTTDLRIPPTSNQAERDLRPAKISVNRPSCPGIAQVA